MSQTKLTIIVTVLGMLVYGVCALKNHIPIRAEKILNVAMWCGAIVIGIYMLIGAFKLSEQPGQETNAIWLGVFGVYLALRSVETMRGLLKRTSSQALETIFC